MKSFLLTLAMAALTTVANAQSKCTNFSGVYLYDTEFVTIAQNGCESITYSSSGNKPQFYPLDGSTTTEIYTDGVGGQDRGVMQTYISGTQIITVGHLEPIGAVASASSPFKLIDELQPNGDIITTLTIGSGKPVVSVRKKIK